MSESPPKVALVTGAGRRLGRSIGLELAATGWAVAVHYHTSDVAAREVAETITAAGGRAETVEADLRDEDATNSLVDRAAAALGALGCLVNNASVFEKDSALSATRETWDMHMQVNLRAPFVLSQAFARQLPEGARGNVVNILDQRVWNPTPHFSSYTVSKAGLWTLTRTLAMALAPAIRVNAVGPGPTLLSLRQTQAQFDRQWKLTPLGRRTRPEEIGQAVRFILDAPAMTGQMIALDGGQHLGWAQAASGAQFEE